MYISQLFLEAIRNPEPTNFRKRSETYILDKDKNLYIGVKDNIWTIPGGGIEPKETPKEAAKRETLEEIGIQVQQLKPMFIKKLDCIKIYGGINKVKDKYFINNNFRGSITYSFFCRYNGLNSKLWGSEDDKYKRKKVTIEEAIEHWTGRVRKPRDEFDKSWNVDVLNNLKQVKKLS